MTTPIQFANETRSNAARAIVAKCEPLALRTYTPSQAVLARSAGVFHWTLEGRRLYDFTSGVLVANLGHNPRRWYQHFGSYLGWKPDHFDNDADGTGYVASAPLTTYNAVTEIETMAVERLLQNVQSCPGSGRLDSVLWAASGAEAIQKTLWACLHHDTSRDILIATRHGFHGKKGLAGAVTGTETDPDRDPRVRFISFPMTEVADISLADSEIDLSRYQNELDALHAEFGHRLNCLITEPYLGGGGSYHPPSAYLQLLERFCRDHDLFLILDEVQSNFGRTGDMYGFATHGIEPDFVVLGKGMGNGVPVNAVVGRGDVMASLNYGEASDTWSANPIACAAVLATLDEFDANNVLEHAQQISPLFVDGLQKLKETSVIAKVRGEGMVFGLECAAVGERSPAEVANRVVEACYLGEPGGDGIHLLGPLTGKVLRVSPPLTITEEEAHTSLDLMDRILRRLSESLEQQTT